MQNVIGIRHFNLLLMPNFRQQDHGMWHLNLRSYRKREKIRVLQKGLSHDLGISCGNIICCSKLGKHEVLKEAQRCNGL